jgi:hypothetical protein
MEEERRHKSSPNTIKKVKEKIKRHIRVGL